MIRRPPRSTQGVSSAASDVYKRQKLRKVEINVAGRWFNFSGLIQVKILRFEFSF